MIFYSLEVDGAYFLEIEPIKDARGFFARCFCKHELEKQGLITTFVQCNTSYNATAGTLRGMHLQKAPYEEVKLVRCTRGAVYDVILDLRPNSPTYKRWASIELTEDNHRIAYVPKGCAHGYQTLTDHSEVFYQVSAPYSQEHSVEIRYNDPQFKVNWPLGNPILSDKDRLCPDYIL